MKLSLALARTLAWALLCLAWLGLGALCLHQGPAGAAWLAPLAFWLLCLGAAAWLVTRWRWTPRAWLLALVLAALVTLSGLLALQHAAGGFGLWLAALGWAASLALVSRGVRWLRWCVMQSAARPGRPTVPALLGAVAAALLAGDPAALAAQPALLTLGFGGLVLAVAILVFVHVRSSPTAHGLPAGKGCRAGLFDCALAWPTARQWRHLRHWHGHAASLAMLPMMAALPWMAQMCSRLGGSGAITWTPTAVTLAHLGAMLLPAAMLPLASQRLRRHAGLLVLLCLLMGAGVALLLPGIEGLNAAMLIQAVAWSLTWGMTLQLPQQRAPQAHELGFDRLPVQAAQGGIAVSAGLAAAAVLGLGALLAWPSVQAWVVLPVILGALAGVAGLARLLDGVRPGRQASSPHLNLSEGPAP